MFILKSTTVNYKTVYALKAQLDSTNHISFRNLSQNSRINSQVIEHLLKLHIVSYTQYQIQQLAF